MSDAQHTQEPWKWYWRENEKGEADCGVISEKREGQAYSVCRAPRYQTKAQWEKDAPLICAAPDLLTALIKLSNEVYGSFPLFEPLARREMGNTNYNCLMLRAEEARAVIARAEGRAP